MIRILIADDHGVVRRGLAQIVAASGDITVGGEASSAEEALERARSERYDVVILDISMPGRSGLDAIGDILEACPGTRIIIMSVHPEEQFAVRCLRDGASAYITKDRADAEILPAIRAVASGRRYMTKGVAERLARRIGSDTGILPHERLTKREFQVLLLIGSGLTVSRIAEQLGLSARTVGTYHTRILAKMGLLTSAQLMKYVIDHGLEP